MSTNALMKHGCFLVTLMGTVAQYNLVKLSTDKIKL